MKCLPIMRNINPFLICLFVLSSGLSWGQGYQIKGKDVRVDASGFNKNLDPTKNDLQKIAEAVDQNIYSTSEINSKLGLKVDKTTTVNGHALSSNVTVSASDVGLGNVDNTSDANKPVSTATQTALNLKENTLTKGNISAGTGVSISGGTGAIIGSGVSVTNTAPDQTVSLTAGTGISTSGIYPNFTITNTLPETGVNWDAFPNTQGYITTWTETDPVYSASSWPTTTNNSINWDTAFGWGDHAVAGYLTSVNWDEIPIITSEMIDWTTADEDVIVGVNWDSFQRIWDFSPINWDEFPNSQGYITQEEINWDAFPNDPGYITTVNWDAFPNNQEFITQDGINWDAFTNSQGFITGVNWDELPIVQKDSINWIDVTELDLIGINWDSYLGGGTGTVNWDEMPIVQPTGINWVGVDETTITGINWDYYAGGGSEADTLATVTGRGASTTTASVFSTSISTPSLISTGAVTVTPAAGSNLNVALSTTGDLAVNTDDLYVDTSSGYVGIGTANPSTNLQISGGSVTALTINSLSAEIGGIDANTQLMLHADGVNGGTTFTDSSSSGKTITAVGTCVTSTAEKKFGTASMFLDGNSDYVYAADSADWNVGNGAFTVDFWAYFNALPGNNGMLFIQGTNGTSFWGLRYENGVFSILAYSSSAYQVNIQATNSVSTGAWHHIAVVRIDNGNAASSWRLFVDGSAQTLSLAAGAWNGTVADYATALYIGAAPITNFGTYVNGYFDEFRWSKGVARWTSNFDPPTVPYDTGTPTNTSLQYFKSAGTTKWTIGSDGTDSDKFKIGSTALGTGTAVSISGTAVTHPGQTVAGDKVILTQTDGNEYLDSLADGYVDIEATTGIRQRINGTEQLLLIDGVLYPTTNNDIDLGDSTHKFKNIYAAGATVTGTITFGTPFVLGTTTVTSTGTQLNYLNAATGTTGTTSSNLVYSASPTFTGTTSHAIITTSGTFNSTATSDLGWSVKSAADTACNTTCVYACVHGWDTSSGEVAVGCTDATADKCLCAGIN